MYLLMSGISIGRVSDGSILGCFLLKIFSGLGNLPDVINSICYWVHMVLIVVGVGKGVGGTKGSLKRP